MAHFDSDKSPLAPHPPQLNGNSDSATPDPNSSDEASGIMENCPKPNGVLGNKSSNRRIEMLRSSGNHCLRRSPRLVENAGGESTGKEVNSLNLDGSVEKSRPFKKHKSGKRGSFFIGEPIPADEARRRWPWRYEETKVCAAVMWFDLFDEVFLDNREIIAKCCKVNFMWLEGI